MPPETNVEPEFDITSCCSCKDLEWRGCYGSGAKYNNIVGSIRRLTPLECERLQGFPPHWTDCGVSDTQRYRCLGNAVTVPVIEAVMTAIREKGGL